MIQQVYKSLYFYTRVRIFLRISKISAMNSTQCYEINIIELVASYCTCSNAKSNKLLLCMRDLAQFQDQLAIYIAS